MTESHVDTQVLIERAQKGDQLALDTVFARYAPRLKALIAARLGEHLRGFTSVDDIVQESLLLALGSLQRFRWETEDAFIRWLGGIAENAIRKIARRECQDRRLRLEPPAGEAVSPSKELRRGERFERLRGALERLTDAEREAILLVRIDGLRIQQAAARMGRTETAVRNLLLRALRKLRESLRGTESLRLPARSLRLEDDRAGGAP